MASRFRCAAGVVAIWDGEGDTAPFDDPLANLARVKFHSALDYVRVVDVKEFTLALPAIPTSGSGQGSGGRNGLRTNLYTLGAHDRAGQPFVVGQITVDGVDIAFVGSVPVHQNTGGDYARWVALGVDSTNVTVYEYSVQFGNAGSQVWESRPAQSLPVTVYITDVLL